MLLIAAARPTPRPADTLRSLRSLRGRLTPVVETVEKVLLQKIIALKWDNFPENRLVFGVSSHIWAIFSVQVGDFCKDFLDRGFFDNLVGHLPFRGKRT
ncbi:MAG: hypothetical protein DDG60_11585 [Anaerolineae bacterium]|nr:MAG: hypothetical protein DDG60_11585 [Anaerolineae bacterium]